MKKSKKIVLGVIGVLAILMIGYVLICVDVNKWMPIVITILFVCEGVQLGKMMWKKQ